MEKVKCECTTIIKNFIKERCATGQRLFSTSYICVHLPDYGIHNFGKLYSPDTYSRIFRKIRQNPKQYNLHITLADKVSKENYYKIGLEE